MAALLVVGELSRHGRDSLSLAAAPLDLPVQERDFPARCTSPRSLRWNERRGAVAAFDQSRYGATVLECRSVPVKLADALPWMLAAVQACGFPTHCRGAHRPCACVRGYTRCAAGSGSWGLPDFSDEDLPASPEDWLAPRLEGTHWLDALGPENLSPALVSRLDDTRRRMLGARPERLRVPCGQNRWLEYADGLPPVLAVKLQELFGLADTLYIGAVVFR